MGCAAGVYEDDAVEVVFDAEWDAGSDLHGRATGRVGGMVALSDLLNLSKPQAVAATGQHCGWLGIRSYLRVAHSWLQLQPVAAHTYPVGACVPLPVLAAVHCAAASLFLLWN